MCSFWGNLWIYIRNCQWYLAIVLMWKWWISCTVRINSVCYEYTLLSLPPVLFCFVVIPPSFSSEISDRKTITSYHSTCVNNIVILPWWCSTAQKHTNMVHLVWKTIAQNQNLIINFQGFSKLIFYKHTSRTLCFFLCYSFSVTYTCICTLLSLSTQCFFS